MKKVLITGATGFVGSAMAAQMLAQSMQVVALSRNDPQGVRTVAAIEQAAEGFGLDVRQAIKQQLVVIDVNYCEPEQSIPKGVLKNVQVAWHCAAEMSYLPNKLVSSFGVNVRNTVRLFHLLRSCSPKMERFYYMSTAYVAGMQGGYVEEEMHAAPDLINAYQVTKWAAEQSLHVLHSAFNVPITIFRPSVVVGHRHTGWAQRNGFGFYMILQGLQLAQQAGAQSLTFDYQPDNKPDLVSIDALVNDALGLTLQTQGRQRFEVFHSTGGLAITNQALVDCFSRIVGIEVLAGAAQSLIDQRFERAIKLNLPFVNTQWHFDRTQLDRVVSAPSRLQALQPHHFDRMAHWYVGLEA